MIGDQDTICAVSTPPGVGAIAVIRVSGRQARIFAAKVCTFLPAEPESHRLYFGTARTLSDRESMDEVLVSYFAPGKSFTGEETLEISCHGGTGVTSLVLNELVKSGCRPARRGEFTYRAFMNGKLDLVQAEGVLALIESQSRSSAKMALRQLKGHLSRQLEEVEEGLLWALANLEAEIDFSEENLDLSSREQLLERLQEIEAILQRLVKSYSKGRLVQNGLRVALVGRPNVGKSSLLNALLGDERAIVTPHEGTTRDLVEGSLSIDGFPVLFVDTAGLRESECDIERVGIERAKAAMSEADEVFLITDMNSDFWKEEVQTALDGFDKRIESLHLVFNKVDLDEGGVKKAFGESLLKKTGWKGNAFWISAKESIGLEKIQCWITSRIEEIDSEGSPVVIQARHYELIGKVHRGLKTGLGLINSGESVEFIAFELQESLRCLHEILGKEFNEQVIDRIFKEFCLGK